MLFGAQATVPILGHVFHYGRGNFARKALARDFAVSSKQLVPGRRGWIHGIDHAIPPETSYFARRVLRRKESGSLPFFVSSNGLQTMDLAGSCPTL